MCDFCRLNMYLGAFHSWKMDLYMLRFHHVQIPAITKITDDYVHVTGEDDERTNEKIKKLLTRVYQIDSLIRSFTLFYCLTFSITLISFVLFYCSLIFGELDLLVNHRFHFFFC